MATTEPGVGIPLWLKGWTAIQVATFIVAPLVDPRPEFDLVRLLAWVLIFALIGWAMLRHRKGAWSVALFFAGASVFFGALALVPGSPRPLSYALLGLVAGGAELWLLLSADAKQWVDPRPLPDEVSSAL